MQFNRIAGPGATPGEFNGVMVARINTDIALADFEVGVRNLVSDVEIAYWELYFNYRSLDAVIAGRDSALATWRKIYTLYRIGGKGGEAEKEAQARQNTILSAAARVAPAAMARHWAAFRASAPAFTRPSRSCAT